MVHGCCAYGCSNRFKKGCNLGFYRFPSQKERRLQWFLALRRKNFIPNESHRLCGAHFETGRPSKDINHPDYVPHIFTYTDTDFDYDVEQQRYKRGCFTKQLAKDINELSVINSQELEKNSDDSSNDSDSSTTEQPALSEDLLPEFEAIVNKSQLVSADTVKNILSNEFLTNPAAIPERFAIYGKNRIPPQKFTFIDIKGHLLAKFTEKRLRKNTPLEKRKTHHIFTSHKVRQTVQVIIDRKSAKTAYVDIDSIKDYNNLYKIKEEIVEDYEFGSTELFPIESCAIKEENEEEDYYANGFNSNDSSLTESADEDSGRKSDDNLFSWYSELRTLENRKLTL